VSQDKRKRVMVTWTIDRFVIEEFETLCRRLNLKNRSLFAEVCLALGLALLEQMLEEGGLQIETA